MTPDRESRLLAWIALACWGLASGIVGWIIHGVWLQW